MIIWWEKKLFVEVLKIIMGGVFIIIGVYFVLYSSKD